MGVTGSASASTESSTSTAQSEENTGGGAKIPEKKKSHEEDEIPPGLEQQEQQQQEEEEDPTFPWLAIVERAAEGMASGQVRMYDIALTRETVLRLSRMPVVAHGLQRRGGATQEAVRHGDEDICAAILQKDPRLQRLRYRSVPSLCSERTFWSVYSARMLRMIEATMCTEVDVAPPLSAAERWMWLLSIRSAALRTLAFVCCCPRVNGDDEDLAWIWKTMLSIARSDASADDRGMEKRAQEILDKHALQGAFATFHALAAFLESQRLSLPCSSLAARKFTVVPMREGGASCLLGIRVMDKWKMQTLLSRALPYPPWLLSRRQHLARAASSFLQRRSGYAQFEKQESRGQSRARCSSSKKASPSWPRRATILR